MTNFFIKTFNILPFKLKFVYRMKMMEETMEFFAVLPIWNNSGKKIKINDLENKELGYIQRDFKSVLDRVFRYLPISIAKTVHISGKTDGYNLKIEEQSFRENLLKLKWNVHLENNNEEKISLLEDQTKVSTNPRIHYHKNATDYIFKKDTFNRTCKVFIKASNIICAEIKKEKLAPTHLRIILKNNDLAAIELLGIYYIMSLIY